jgi:hypothetical protein
MRSYAPRTAFASLSLFLALLSQAQPTEVGVKAGPIISNWRSSLGGFAPIPGLLVGAYCPVPLTPKLLVQGEANLVVAGTACITDAGRSTLRTYGLHLPVTLRLKALERLECAFGADPGWTLHATNATDDGHEHAMRQLRPFTCALVAGSSFRLSRVNDVALRYVYGVTPLLRNDASVFPTERAVQITFGQRLVRLKGGGSGYRSRNLRR